MSIKQEHRLDKEAPLKARSFELPLFREQSSTAIPVRKAVLCSGAKFDVVIRIVAVFGLIGAMIATCFMKDAYSFIEISTTGIILCVIGLIQRSMKADPWVVIPFAIFLFFDFVSGWMTYGNMTKGYACLHLIYLVIYLLAGCLSIKENVWVKRVCVLWAAAISIVGIISFCFDASNGEAGRLNIIFGNANCLGFFMVLGWFALLGCRLNGEQEDRMRILPRLELFLLVCLTLTMSMGSIVALLVGLIAFLITQYVSGKYASWKETFNEGILFISKFAIAFLIGILIYGAGTLSNLPILCWQLALYCAAFAFFWLRFEDLLKSQVILRAIISLLCIVCAGAAVMLRPSSLSTFAERFAMMGNGLAYMTVDPIFGVGPYQWRGMNMGDSDTYYNVWHIHDAFVHIGVEIGLIALLALVVIVARCLLKMHKSAPQQGENAALLFHLLIDVGFFVSSVMSMFILTARKDEAEGINCGAIATRLIFLLVGTIYGFCFIDYFGIINLA